MWPSVYMHSGNLELCNVTCAINAFQHHVKCHFDITTKYLLDAQALLMLLLAKMYAAEDEARVYRTIEQLKLLKCFLSKEKKANSRQVLS